MTDNMPIHSPPQYIAVEKRSPKNRLVAIALAVFFGYWGLHRFYAGKFWTGILMFLTGGGFLIWWIIDALLLMSGRFTDSEGRVLGPPAKVARSHGTLPSHQTRGHLPSPDVDDELDLDSILEDPLEEEFRKLVEAEARRK